MALLAESLTFNTISDMRGYPLTSADENGLLFAVITGNNQFQMAMWFKDSTATADNVTIFTANGGIGRWHLLGSSGESNSDFLAIIGNNIPNDLSTSINLLAQKKTDGTFDLKARFNGVFHSLLDGEVVVYNETLPTGNPPPSKKIALLNKAEGKDEIYISTGNEWTKLNISLTPEDQILFSQLPTGTTANTVAIGNHSHTLNGLSDVAINSPISGNVLKHDGTSWKNSPASEVLMVEGNQIPSTISGDTDLVVLKKTDGTKELKAKFGGVFEDLITGGGGGAEVAYYSLNTTLGEPSNFTSIPDPADTNKSAFAIIEVYTPGYDSSYRNFYLYCWVPNNGWMLLSTRSWSGSPNFSNREGLVAGEIRNRNFISHEGDFPIDTTAEWHLFTGNRWLALPLKNTPTPSATYTKVNVNPQGLVTDGYPLLASDIPVLDTSKITTGTFDISRIPNLSTSKITSGVFDISFIPTGTTSTTVALGNHTHAINALTGGATGWVPMTGVADKATTLDTTTVTVNQLAERVKALQDALTTLGLLKP